MGDHQLPRDHTKRRATVATECDAVDDQLAPAMLDRLRTARADLGEIAGRGERVIAPIRRPVGERRFGG